MNNNQFLSPTKQPRLYAYTTPNERARGRIKIGYTERDVATRIWEQFPTKTPNEKPFEILWEQLAMDKHGNFFTDRDIHKKLKQAGFHNPNNSEWFECDIADIERAYNECVHHKNFTNKARFDFAMRPEQQRAVDMTAEYFTHQKLIFPDKPAKFLWNAKMRFGKTFTAYQLAKKMQWQRVLILTYKPAVQPAWENDLQNHIDFDHWQFWDKAKEFNNIDQTRPFVAFRSYQDILGKTKQGRIKENNIEINLIDWDCIILDEYHFGAWRDNAKKIIENDNINDGSEFENDDNIDDDYDLGIFSERDLINAPFYLYLSGTPFRAVASGEFLENEIFNWTYTDEQRAKLQWNQPDENPYLELPKMVMMTYQLPEHVTQIAQNTDKNEFSLNEFFRAEQQKADLTGDKIFKFKHENQVQSWLNIIRGHEQIFNDNRDYSAKTPPLPFYDTNLLPKCNHTIWYLPSVASCRAMAELLKQRNNIFYHDYKILCVAGTDAGVGLKALTPVETAIGNNPFINKTIVLTCGKLTTGVTVPAWTGIFYLRDLESPESYFQAGFRVQSPFVVRNQSDSRMKEIIKQECYIFDFAPNRALNLIASYVQKIDLNDTRKHADKIADFINFLPILHFDGFNMELRQAEEILDIAFSGVGATMLARRWQSAQLIDMGNPILEKLLQHPELIKALEHIPAFRGLSDLNNHITKIVNHNNNINKLNKKTIDDGNNAQIKQEISKEKKDKQTLKKLLQEKLLKFITRIPIFMFLSSYREETLIHVIENLETDLFTKCTGLSLNDFHQLCEIGVFQKNNINEAIWAFKRFEEPSLNYIGGRTINNNVIGGFDEKLVQN